MCRRDVALAAFQVATLRQLLRRSNNVTVQRLAESAARRGTWRCAALAALVLLVAVGCHSPRTQLLVTVDTDLAYGPAHGVRFVNITVRSGAADGPVRLQRSLAVAPDGSNGATVMPFSFGVYARDNDPERIVWIEALACGADACAQGHAVVTERVITNFVAAETTAVAIHLSTACENLACVDANTTCDANDRLCVDAHTAAAHDAGASAATALSAGGGTSCARLGNGTVSCWGGLDSVWADLAFPSLASATSSAPAAVPALDAVEQIAVGVGHACALRTGGRVTCWGRNDHGQLGDGTSSARSGGVDAMGITTAVEVAAGRDHTCARLMDGGVQCWGSQQDPVHPGLLRDRLAPVTVRGVANAVQIAAGDDFDCALVADGTVSCWGLNDAWQLGTGDRAPTVGVVTVAQVADATRIATGAGHACARLRSGSVVCWGDNAFGERGNGLTTVEAAPTAMIGVSNVADVSAGAFHTCVRTADGAVYCVGRNDRGQLGDGTTIDRTTPVRVPGLTDVVDVRAGIEHTCAREHDGPVRCWGSDVAGQLGLGREMAHAAPQNVALADVREITAGGAHTCALTDSQSACWGLVRAGGRIPWRNAPVQLGARVSWPSPTVVPSLPAPIRQVALGSAFACALLADGTVRCWGNNARGQLGDGTLEERPTPVAVAGLDGVVEIALGDQFACAVRSDGTVRCWGDDDDLQLGRVSTQACGDSVCANTAAPVPGLEGVTHIATSVGGGAGNGHACALLRDGSVRCWGNNTRGQLASSDVSIQGIAIPTAVPGLEHVTELAAGNLHTCALRDDGTIACWGCDATGQLGDVGAIGTNCNGDPCSTTPVPLPAPGLHFVDIVAGPTNMCARTDAGEVYCWGADDQSQTTGVPMPMPVAMCPGGPCAPLTHIAAADGAVQLALGQQVTCARSATGAVTCWGSPAYGQTGEPSPTQYMAPTPIHALDGVTDLVTGVVTMCARFADGRLRCAGDNSRGEIGNGTPGNPRTPVVAHVTSVSGAALGEQHTCAVRTDGTVWCWGANFVGQLGDGTTTNHAVPAPVVGITNAVQLASGFVHTCARLADGTVQCWGFNYLRSVGDGSSAMFVPTPSTVLGVTDAVEIAAGGTHTCARTAVGDVMCWGSNQTGELGTGSTGDSALASRVVGLPAAAVGLVAGADVGAGQYSCAVLVDGSVWCWGVDASGELGNGMFETHPVPTPTRVVGLPPVVSARGLMGTVCAATTTGETYCWGANNQGLFGTGGGPSSNVPVPLAVSSVDEVSPGLVVNCARRTDPSAERSVLCWGDNHFDTLGSGSTFNSSASPMIVDGLTHVRDLFAGPLHTCAVDDDAVLWCWGENASGELGDGTQSTVPTFEPVENLGAVSRLAAGFGFGCASVDDGTVRCWGADSEGQLGPLTSVDSDDAVSVSSIDHATSIAVGSSHACALIDDGTATCWGRDDTNQLGQTGFLWRSFTLGVDGLSNATALSAGSEHTCALRADGTVACWGSNAMGQLGTTAAETCPLFSLEHMRESASVPCSHTALSVDTLSGIASVSAGGRHTCAVDATGTVSCWGANAFGQLGDGTTVSRMAPAPVALPNIAQVAAGNRVRCSLESNVEPECASSGEDHTCARTGDGLVYCWGRNDRGQLGDGSTVDRSAPVAVSLPALADDLEVGGAHTCVLLRDGSVMCWGDDSEGALGDGALVYSTTPRHVPGT